MAPSHTPDAGDPDDVYDCFESLPDVVWAFEGPDHRVVAANRAARDSVGNRPGLLGLPVREAIPEAVGQQLFEQLDRVYEAGEPLIGRQWRTLVDRDGDGVLEEAWFDFTLMPRRAEDGSVCGVVARCVDVTLDVAGRDLADALPGESAPREGTFADTALTLQRVTLPTGLPVLPQVWLAASYLAGDEELAAGGDWFDAVPIGRGRVALSVGDVVGHGAEATAAMGQLRIVLAEALMDGVPPTEALARLNRYAIRVPDTRAATTCLAVIDPTVGEIQYGAFGHPAPLVIGQGGATRFLPLPPSRPLGVSADPPVLRTARMTAGEVLLLYTDGLVERPGRTLAEGMADLASVASAAIWETPASPIPGPAADRLCSVVVERLTRSGYSDDVTVLAAEMRVEPHRPLAIELPAEAMWLRGIRRALDEWLHGVGAGEQDVPAVHLAVIEAATNCVEHAYRDANEAGWMWLDAVLDGDGRLRVTMTDHGRWRPPPRDPEHRGRGLRLMNSLMESVDVHRTEGGTTVTMARTLRHSAVLSPPARQPVLAPSAPDFGTEIRPGEPPRLLVSGPVDTTSAPTLLNRISELSRGGVLPVDVDLSDVTHLASAGVRVLFECARTAQEGPGPVRLVVPQGSPARLVVELTGLDRALEVLAAPR